MSKRPHSFSSESESHEHRVSSRLMANYREFMKNASTSQKNYVKEVMAEQYMEHTAKLRGVRMTLTPADKGHRGGPDADMRDRNGRQIRAEAKAERAGLSKGQRNPEKTLVTDPRKSIKGQGQFQRGSGLDRRAAQLSQRTLRDGGSINYEVNRTRATANGFSTAVTKRTYAAATTQTQGGPVTTRHDPSIKSDHFAEPGRATIPLRSSMRMARPVAPPSLTRGAGSRPASSGRALTVKTSAPGSLSRGPTGKL